MNEIRDVRLRSYKNKIILPDNATSHQIHIWYYVKKGGTFVIKTIGNSALIVSNLVFCSNIPLISKIQQRFENRIDILMGYCVKTWNDSSCFYSFSCLWLFRMSCLIYSRYIAFNLTVNFDNPIRRLYTSITYKHTQIQERL